MVVKRAILFCLALTACGEVRLVPSGDGGDQEAASAPTLSGQAGTTAVVTIVVSPTGEAGAPATPPPPASTPADADQPDSAAPDCEGGGCNADANGCANVACPMGHVCMEGNCQACSGDQVACAGTCVNLDDNRANCGACGNACPIGQMCMSGTCRCKDGQALCGLVCVPTMSDVTNCGDCGVVCLVTQKCNSGKCVDH